MSQIPYDLPVTTKNLEYLEELMRQEALACKKCTQYGPFFQDRQLQDLCGQLKTHHKQRFDALYQFLDSHK